MRRFLWVTVAAVVAVVAAASAQTTKRARSVVRLQPALDAVIDSTSELELLKDDYFGFIDGQVWSPGGYMLITDMGANKIYKWTPKSELSIYLARAGDTGAAG